MIAKALKKRITAAAAAELMESNKFNPIQELINIVRMKRAAPTNEAELKSMLWTDWEIGEDGDLQLRSRIRADICMELARFMYPRLKVNDAGDNDRGPIQVSVKTFIAPGGVATKVETAKLIE